MKKIYTIILSLLFSAFLLTNTSCSDDCDDLILKGDDAFIISCFAHTGSSSFGSSYLLGDTITLAIPSYKDINTVNVKVEISEHATISPSPQDIEDWSVPVTFQVTSLNANVTNTYVVKLIQTIDFKEYDGVVRLGSQTELDNFFENGYTKIQNLILYKGDIDNPIKNLSSMKTLKDVTGDLLIFDIAAREIRLENLENVGQFYLNSPSATRVILPKLKFVAERFKVGKDDSGLMPIPHADMKEVRLPSLEYVGSGFELFWCEKLESLESLSKLKYVGKDFKITGGVFTDLKGLENIKKITGNVTLDGNLGSLEGFAIESVGGILTLSLDNVLDLSPLSVLKNVDNAVFFRNNKDLKNLKGLEHINTPSIQLQGFSSVESLEGFPQMSTFKTLIITGFAKLTDISALSNLEKVENSLTLFALPELINLTGLDNLEYVGGNLSLDYLHRLENINALSKLNHVGGQLKLAKMGELKDISVFSNLTQVGSLYLENLLKVENLMGLHNITTITKGGLSVLVCNELTDLTALGNITDVNFYAQADKIAIEMNAKLASYIPIGDLLKKYIPMRKVQIKNNFYNPTASDVNEDRLEGEGGNGISGGR